MKCDVVSRRLLARLTLGVAAIMPTTPYVAAQQGYAARNYPQAGGPIHQASPIPTAMMPGQGASPLAGGPAAINGGQFVDVHGNPIILPASYQAAGGYCPPGPAGMGAYGDPMAVDFGGYSQDQIGPHYFDVSFGVVALKSDNVLNGVGPLASITAGANAPRILDPATSLDEYDPGWQIAFRYDLGPLSVFEASYTGLYDIAFEETVRSVDVTTMPPNTDFALNTVFSNFGVIPISGVDAGSVYSLNYNSDLQSTDLSYRRYWVGNSPRVSGTYLLGFRYVRMTEDLDFNILADDGQGVGNLVTSRLGWETENDLLGFQIGGDGWLGLRQGLRVGCEGKAGVYNNRYNFRGLGDFAVVPPALPGGVDPPADFVVTDEGNEVAFVGEIGINVVADILPSWSVRAGYHAWYLDNLATVASNIDTATFVPARIHNQNDALYHGFSAGAEYVW